MKIVPTFASQNLLECNLWTACYAKHAKDKKGHTDIFSRLFNLWNDTQYLQTFFIQNQLALTEYKPGMNINNAVDTVLDEALDFEQELKSIEVKRSEFKHQNLKKIFYQLDIHEFALRQQTATFRKGKPNLHNPLLRLYAIELEDCFIVTGGGIKIAHKMSDGIINKENDKLKQVQDYLRSQGINSKTGLIESYEQ